MPDFKFNLSVEKSRADKAEIIHAGRGDGTVGIPPGRHSARDIDPGHHLPAEEALAARTVAVLGQHDLYR